MKSGDKKVKTIDSPQLSRELKEARSELATAFSKLSKPEEVEQAFIDFLTVGEQRDLYSRWLIFKMLEAGEKQRDISKKLGVSLCKITRGSRFLKSSNTIVKRMLADAREKDAENGN
jgi:TrpR family trp operon transcriptional repressor